MYIYIIYIRCDGYFSIYILFIIYIYIITTIYRNYISIFLS